MYELRTKPSKFKNTQSPVTQTEIHDLTLHFPLLTRVCAANSKDWIALPVAFDIKRKAAERTVAWLQLPSGLASTPNGLASTPSGLASTPSGLAFKGKPSAFATPRSNFCTVRSVLQPRTTWLQNLGDWLRIVWRILYHPNDWVEDPAATGQASRCMALRLSGLVLGYS